MKKSIHQKDDLKKKKGHHTANPILFAIYMALSKKKGHCPTNQKSQNAEI